NSVYLTRALSSSSVARPSTSSSAQSRSSVTNNFPVHVSSLSGSTAERTSVTITSQHSRDRLRAPLRRGAAHELAGGPARAGERAGEDCRHRLRELLRSGRQ